jgi:protein phosphatase-4 regulatory subunit 3
MVRLLSISSFMGGELLLTRFLREFVNESQQRLGLLNNADDGLSDDILDQHHILSLPEPDMSNLADIDNNMRISLNTAPTRDGLMKFIIANDYIAKLTPLVRMAEDFESLPDLHRLCSIMKSMILLNDNAVMEQVVRDDLFEDVVGALECKPISSPNS